VAASAGCTTYKSHLFLRAGCYNTSAWHETANRRAVRGGHMIPEDHPLQKLFIDLVGQHYAHEIGIRDPELVGYVAHLLTEFCDAEQLFKIQNAFGKPIADVGEMLLQADPVFGPASSFDRERQIRKHIGDYTLFFAGMFPESINHLRLRRQRLESFVDWMKAGKESYFIVSKFDCFEYTKVAPLFEKLSARFEQCVYGLNCVKNELQEMQHPIVRQANELLM
jgi:hypothetical protein